MPLPNLYALSARPPVAATGQPYTVASLSHMDEVADWTPGMLYDELPNLLTYHHQTAEERSKVAELYVDFQRNAALILLTASKVVAVDPALALRLAARAEWLAVRIKGGRILETDPESTFTQSELSKLVNDRYPNGLLEPLDANASLYVFFTAEDDASPDLNDLPYVYIGAYKKMTTAPSCRAHPTFTLDAAKNGYKLYRRIDEDEVDKANKFLVNLATALGSKNVQVSMAARWGAS